MYSIININKAQNVKQQQSHFLFAFIFFLIQLSQEEKEKTPHSDLLKNKSSWHEKSKILIYISVSGKKQIKTPWKPIIFLNMW